MQYSRRNSGFGIYFTEDAEFTEDEEFERGERERENKKKRMVYSILADWGFSDENIFGQAVQ